MLLLQPSIKRLPFQFKSRAIHRSLTTSSPLRALTLAYDLHEPPPAAANRKRQHTTRESAAPPIIFLHGLFGSKRNNRGISKVLARDLNRPVYALDLRNHGDSPHDPSHTYGALADDVERFMGYHKISEATVIGHSMGAKTAMALALKLPHLVKHLIAVDNAPVDAELRSDFGGYIKGMKEVEKQQVKSQREADEILQGWAKELPVRQFLLTNFVRSSNDADSHLVSRVPLKTLGMNLNQMADFPYKDPKMNRYVRRALFIRGTQSHYVSDETLPAIGEFFPRFELKDVDCGHWVISEKPEEFRQAVVDFLGDF